MRWRRIATDFESVLCPLAVANISGGCNVILGSIAVIVKDYYRPIACSVTGSNLQKLDSGLY